METRKLYYEDSHCREFEAEVVSCEEGKNGFQVVLDATAFYPEGGGQACDLGNLGDAQVLDVQELEGEIVHFCDRPLTVGAEVAGVIDWQRRFDLMQQHSGEHMVSGLIHQKYGYENIGFHLGEEVITLDFSGFLTFEGLREIEDRANELIWKNEKILVHRSNRRRSACKLYKE